MKTECFLPKYRMNLLRERCLEIYKIIYLFLLTGKCHIRLTGKEKNKAYSTISNDVPYLSLVS